MVVSGLIVPVASTEAITVPRVTGAVMYFASLPGWRSARIRSARAIIAMPATTAGRRHVAIMGRVLYRRDAGRRLLHHTACRLRCDAAEQAPHRAGDAGYRDWHRGIHLH